MGQRARTDGLAGSGVDSASPSVRQSRVADRVSGPLTQVVAPPAFTLLSPRPDYLTGVVLGASWWRPLINDAFWGAEGAS
ncbi:hypothetical protein Pcinc_001838 [Petrolisthes cinctipes]|uniref:Uncharacterized protein n=1 Tax=Petrolisthes cinctipes TaxID=88211 RepID=A0AAE1GM16_PETCI|nr:hypothetical protein Pcinc_001838 [Petrolisthes cinctipes]